MLENPTEKENSAKYDSIKPISAIVEQITEGIEMPADSGELPANDDASAVETEP
jgi:hypothetical protein